MRLALGRPRALAALGDPALRRSLLAEGGGLVVLVLAAAAARILLGRDVVAPGVVGDELTYASWARAFAESGDLADLHATPLGNLLYQLLISPAWLAGDMQTTYGLAKAIGAGAMCLVAVPVHLLARRLVGPWWSLLAVALTLALPSFVYAGTLLTETAFLPVFALAALACARMLERPTRASQGLVVLAIALACLVRVQALVLVLALLTAIPLKAVLDLRAAREPLRGRPLARALAPYRWTLAAIVLAAVLYVVVGAVRGTGLAGGLGFYGAAVEDGYRPGFALRYVLLHLGEAPLAVGVVPVVALVALVGVAWRRGASTTAAERAFLAVAACVPAWVVLQTGVFSSRFSERITERYVACALPLLVVALVLWCARGLPRPRGWIAVAVAAPLAGVLLLPLDGLIASPLLIVDTFGVVPLRWLANELPLGSGDMRLVLGLALLAVAVAVSTGPRRWLRLGLPAALLVYLALAQAVVQSDLAAASANYRNAPGLGGDANWLDRAVGADADVLLLYTTSPDANQQQTLFQQLRFWNRSARDERNLSGDAFRAPNTVVGPDGSLVALFPELPLPAPEYVLVDALVPLVGETVVARPPFVLLRPELPLRAVLVPEGIAPDGWAGASSSYDVYAPAPGGRVQLQLSLIPWNIGARPSTVRVDVGPLATDGGARSIAGVTDSRSLTMDQGQLQTIDLAAPPPPFRVEIHVDPTYAPASFGLPDERQLGVQPSLILGGG
ncbi:MAG: glycosyltransferase family 39 protein [Thermoleophilia bacterium]